MQHQNDSNETTGRWKRQRQAWQLEAMDLYLEIEEKKLALEALMAMIRLAQALSEPEPPA